MSAQVGDKQCEVVLVGCGAPNRGMGWYHAEQVSERKILQVLRTIHCSKRVFFGEIADAPR